jgi:lipoate-protein ligase A
VTGDAVAWRFVDSGAASGSLNMATDRAIMESHAAGQAPATLRVYRWEPPAVSLGYHQRLAGSVSVDACLRLGIDICRRPTGGRAILHDREVTFSVIASDSILGTASVMDAYRVLAAPIVAAMRALGVDARLVDRDAGERVSPPAAAPTAAPRAAIDPVCFAAKARCDIMVDGRKIIGSAQLRRSGVVLQQSSLPLHLELERGALVFEGRHAQRPDDLAEVATDLCSAAAREIEFAEVADALRAAFESTLGFHLSEQALTPQERARAEQLEPEHRAE